MPTAKVNDINIYYEIHGEGDPFTIINGHGGSVEFLYYTIPVYSKEYKLILFDNRGAGRSDAPDIPYTMEMMADDLAGLLDTINIDSTHIMGISMGGMIAQHFALRHPEKVKSLVLGCTYCGGPNSSLTPDPEVAQATQSMSGLPAKEMMKELLRISVSPGFIEDNPDVIEASIEMMSKQPVNPKAMARQMQAIMSHNTYERLPEIKVPTLVLHGEADRIVPVENAKIIASRISNANLVTFPNTGHIFLESQEEFNSSIFNFLRQNQGISE